MTLLIYCVSTSECGVTVTFTVRDRETPGSNPGIPTEKKNSVKAGSFLSECRDSNPERGRENCSFPVEEGLGKPRVSQG